MPFSYTQHEFYIFCDFSENEDKKYKLTNKQKAYKHVKTVYFSRIKYSPIKNNYKD